MSLLLARTTGGDPAFQRLVPLLDAELAALDGAAHGFYDQFNGSTALAHAVVGALAGEPIAIGALRPLGPGLVELKRMFVRAEHRGRGHARAVLAELEAWALELGATHARLETGVRQVDAIALYRGAGYAPIANYGPYVGVAASVCFERALG
jgi:putative acetyltransferase